MSLNKFVSNHFIHAVLRAILQHSGKQKAALRLIQWTIRTERLNRQSEHALHHGLQHRAAVLHREVPDPGSGLYHRASLRAPVLQVFGTVVCRVGIVRVVPSRTAAALHPMCRVFRSLFAADEAVVRAARLADNAIAAITQTPGPLTLGTRLDVPAMDQAFGHVAVGVFAVDWKAGA